MEKRYKVILHRFDGKVSKPKYTGLTLKQAQAICSDPETSSRTAKNKSKYAKCAWFFGYTEM